MKISFNAVARPIYRKMVNASHAKYTDGRGARPIDEPKPVKGIAVKTAMPVKVNIMRGNDARLWIKGSLGVRIIWMTRVWLHMDSTNQPAWNKAM